MHMDHAVNPAEEVSREGAGLAIAQHHHEAESLAQALIHKQRLATLINAQVGCISSLLMYPGNNSRLEMPAKWKTDLLHQIAAVGRKN